VSLIGAGFATRAFPISGFPIVQSAINAGNIKENKPLYQSSSAKVNIKVLFLLENCPIFTLKYENYGAVY
jgi:hypothetical protein